MKPAEMIEVQFGKWNRSHPLPHCEILTKQRVLDIVASGEIVPVVSIRTSDGGVLALGPKAIEWKGRAIDYSEIERHEWIDLDHQEKARNKTTHFDRLHLITKDGTVMIEGLGQAVFPLMKSLEMIQKDRKKAANQALQTTSVTRTGFGKVPVSDRTQRGV